MLIYTEDFASPADDGRFGCDAVKNRGRWYPDMVPYVEMDLGNGSIEESEKEVGRDIASGLDDREEMVNRIYLPRSKNLTVGVQVQFFEYYRDYGYDLIQSFKFRSYLDNSSTSLLNFTVEVSITAGTYLQKADIHFITGGSGYPEIPPVTVNYDFLQPMWIWVQCDMSLSNPDGTNGACRVWFNNDLMVTKENIYTGDIDNWESHLPYKYNNALDFTLKGSYYLRPGTHAKYYTLAAVNEELSYMDSALGNIDVTGLTPSSVTHSQWWAHLDGVDLDIGAVEVLNDSLHTDYTDLHTKAHMRTDGHLIKDLYKHHNSFINDTDIIAVTHRIVHRMYDIESGGAVLRIEPVIQTSGRDMLMDRTKGQLSEGNMKTLFVNYTTPYAGAFWDQEILDLTSFGFSIFKADRIESIEENLILLGEYDVENIYDGFELSVIAQDDDYLLGGTVKTHILDEGFDVEDSAIDGETP